MNVLKDVLQNEVIEISVKKYDSKLKNKALMYLKSVESNIVGDMVLDCKTGDDTGIEEKWFEKDGFEWNTSDIYHFETYNAELSEDFYNFIISA